LDFSFNSELLVINEHGSIFEEKVGAGGDSIDSGGGTNSTGMVSNGSDVCASGGTGGTSLGNTGARANELEIGTVRIEFNSEESS
jgi:hypothetical protein